MTKNETSLTAKMAALDDSGAAYVHAVVVRAQAPTSTWPGAAALVMPDGEIDGFVGGQCAETTVRSASLEALESNEPILLRILPEDEDEFPETPGARTVVNPCLSGGSIEIFLAPHIPPDRIVIVGATPIAHAIADMARLLGFSPIRVDEPGDDLVAPVAMIISSHGRYEGEAVRLGLDAGIGFIGLVASARRGAAVVDELALSEEDRSRIRTPVGLDIGARGPHEIAMSILAEVVRSIRLEGLAAPRIEETASQPPPTAIDPICGMTVVAAPPTISLDHDGSVHWFCNPGCRDQFEAQLAADSAGAGR